MQDAFVIAQSRQDWLQKKFKALLAAIRPSLICDIGSLNGVDAVEFKLACATSTVLAFEANLTNYENALTNPDFKKYDVLWTYTAIGDRDGVTIFNVIDVPNSGYDWRGGASSLLVHRGEATREVKVPVRRLDSFLKDHDLLDQPKALWIDVEGAESIVLSGAQEALKTTLFLKVEVETFEHWRGQKFAEETLAPLFEMGFVQIDSSKTEGVTQYDVLLVSKQLADLGIK